MSAAPNLRVINDDGEVLEDGCPTCQLHQVDRENVEAELRKALRKVRELKQDKEAQAKVHPRRQEIEAVFGYWKEQCKHPNSKLDADRAFLIAWGIDNYGVDTCKLAIRGAALEPFVTSRKNNTEKRHDGIGLVFRNAEKFEEFCNRAPVQDAVAGSEANGSGEWRAVVEGKRGV